jgi:predicted phosphoribosyltransferase
MSRHGFSDRRDAGSVLAASLREYAGRDDVVVLGLQRGGVPVARVVADELRAPLDVFLVRKLGVPGHEELALGAIASGGVRVLNESVVRVHGLTPADVEEVTAREQQRLRRHEEAFRGDRPALSPAGKVALIVDDGVATGATMRAAAETARALGASRVVCAVPVAPPSAPAAFVDVCDEFVAAVMPEHFRAVGQFYEDFTEVSDDDVRDALAGSADGSGHRG